MLCDASAVCCRAAAVRLTQLLTFPATAPDCGRETQSSPESKFLCFGVNSHSKNVKPHSCSSGGTHTQSGESAADETGVYSITALSLLAKTITIAVPNSLSQSLSRLPYSHTCASAGHSQPRTLIIWIMSCVFRK